MEEKIICPCTLCGARSKTDDDTDGREEFNFDTVQTDLKFPQIGTNGETYALESVVKAFDKTLPKETHLQVALEGIKLITYYKCDDNALSVTTFGILCDQLLNNDLNEIIIESKLAAELLERICQLFVMSWHAYKVEGNEKAEWAARKFRTILSLIVTHPVIQKEVNQVFFGAEVASKWPVSGPVKILEILCKESLDCLETVTLMVNLTRIEHFCQYLSEHSSCIQVLEDKFQFFCDNMENYTDYSYYLLLLYMNATVVENFMKFMLTSNGKYFPIMILPDLIGSPSSHEPNRKAIWPFFKNLAMTKDGREMIMELSDLYLGHILYPIAGPEPLRPEVATKLPVEVCNLPANKKRAKDSEIRECVLDILYLLCRYKKDRDTLRDLEVYEILRLYHLAEEDNQLSEKIENLVNILIRKEGAEIEVDDLLHGLNMKTSDGQITN